MRNIYMDYNATAPVRPCALDAFTRVTRDCCGNASSAHHFGRAARRYLDDARAALAACLGVEPREVIFTSGGTESDNLAIKGVMAGYEKGHIVTSSIEHPAVLETCRFLERQGFDVTYLDVDDNGRVDPGQASEAIRDDTRLMSIMSVNNETGVVQPVEALAESAHERGIVFHTDAVQGFARLPMGPTAMPADLLSLSGHKFGAPKGVGALVVRKGVKLNTVSHGGGQEWNTRSGTHNVAGAAAMAAAASEATQNRERDQHRIAALRDRLERGFLDSITDCHVNGADATRVANTANIRLDGADGEAVLIALDERGISASSASACAAAHTEPSHVLMAMGLSRRQAEDSMRFSLGVDSTTEDVDRLLEEAPEVVERIRAL